ncbi:MAG TPA: dihydrolipoamide acetyltransferase family protein [Anaerolineae bacterium]|nr:dihydrolipoamide acetyltransferase family protein [Anaerolineae bacterium]
MATELTMPKMGFDMTEGKLAQWLKQVGEPVKRGEPIAEIETDKVNIEIEAPDNGVLRGTFLEPGQTVPVGTLIGVLGKPDEQIDVEALRKKAGGAAPPPVAVTEKEEAPAAQETRSGLSEPLPAAPGRPPPRPEAQKPGAPAEPTKTNGRIKASPLARRMAEEAGLDLTEVAGTGPGGRITKRDIDKALAEARAVAPAPAAPRAPAPAILGPAVLKTEEIPFSKLRQTIARRMTASKQQAPHFYVTSEVDMAEAMALRAQLNALTGDAGKISVNDLVVKAAALALTHFPNLNASFSDTTLKRRGEVHVGIAVALDEGLITVVVRDADRKPLAQIAREARDIIGRARSGKARLDELQGSTFTVSNLGMFDVDSFVAIINPPEAAILAVGSVRDVPVVKEGQVVPGQRMHATISADHRVTDGAEAARFMQVFKQNLEEPLRLVL